MRFAALLLAFLSAHQVSAHEMLPAHPVMRLSYVDGVLQTQMQLFNKRQDVEFYEVGVFDEDWNPVSFVTGYRIIRLQYLEQVKFDVYILKQDANKAEYICSRSKLRGESSQRAIVASRICSRIVEASE
tara:strand:+ start:102 stop:488 length:387 start_codon:yes stop_codon:yes gene_type:complete